MIKGIKIGVISSCLTIFFFAPIISPILDFLSNKLLWTLSFVSNSLTDRLYEEIAVGKTDYALVLTSSILIVVLFVNISIFKFGGKEVSKDTDSIKEDEGTTEESNQNKKNDAPSKKIWNKVISSFNILLIFLISSGFIVSSHLKNQIIDSFNQNMRIVAPYIDENHEEVLISKFSNMKSRKDYDIIQQEFKGISEKNNFDLPESKIHLY